MSIEKLNSMTVGIAKVHEAGIARAEMSVRAVFNGSSVPVLRQLIADEHEVIGLRDGECRVVEARARSMSKHDVVRVSLAL